MPGHEVIEEEWLVSEGVNQQDNHPPSLECYLLWLLDPHYLHKYI